ncbi:hypothetical protein JHK82_038072 [Glycine max]|nr:hypothetical protein JHK85_038822 [Glycine max]KAG5114803.1 hypothetical protein JHK82_038072 [Glycine max]KAG5132084.1 hypothetical protein JHK84_038481 [Glycine max]
MQVLGWSMWFAEYIFLERNWTKDETSLKGQLAYLKEGNNVQDKSPAITSGEKSLP